MTIRFASVVATAILAAALPAFALDTTVPSAGLPSAADYASQVLPEINGYWERAEFPWPLVAKLGRAGIVGDGIAGYGCPDIGVGLVVPVHDQPVAGHPRGQCEGELALRGHVHPQPLLHEHPQHGHGRLRLAGEHGPGGRHLIGRGPDADIHLSEASVPPGSHSTS